MIINFKIADFKVGTFFYTYMFTDNLNLDKTLFIMNENEQITHSQLYENVEKLAGEYKGDIEQDEDKG